MCNRNFKKFFTLVFCILNAQITKGLQTLLNDGEEFDFVVVGGGTAGCVVATRLAESGKHTVLLIHEGGIPNPGLDIPATAIWLAYPDDVKYFYSTPQQNAALSENGIVRMGVGTVMGGGSSVNGMFWNRGNPRAYNEWARVTKDESWSYDNLIKYYKKIENYVGFNPTDQRGYGGPISVNNPIYAPAIAEFIEGSQEIGYPLADANGPQIPSVTVIDFSYDRNRRRVSSYSGYILPLLKTGADYGAKKNNLVILLNTKAKVLKFEGNKAVGVNYVMNTTKFSSYNSSLEGFVKVRKEIILSAGVMDSPAILMRSGIGPKDVLKRANIRNPIKYLPVGKNLHDHPLLRVPVIYGNRSAALVVRRDLSPDAFKQFEQSADGPYSSFWGCGAQGFFLSSLQTFNGYPDIHLIPLGFEDTSDEVDDLQEWEVIVKWIPIMVLPQSRGTVTLNPKELMVHP